MAQLYAVSGLPRLRRNQTSELNARVALLPQIMAQKSQSEYNKASIANMKASQELEEKKYGMETSKFNLAQQEYGLKEKGLTLQERQAKQAEQQFGWQQDQAEDAANLRKESEQKQMGVQGAGLGFNLISGKGTTVGSLMDKAGGLWSGLFGDSSGTTSPTSTTSSRTGGLYDMNLAAVGGGGLIGAGAGQILGAGNKLKKSTIGLGVGGLASFIGSGGDWSSALGGGLLGGLSGLIL